MNRKFVKENKKPLKEFLSFIVAAALGAKGLNDIDKVIDSSPELTKKREDLRQIGKELTVKMRKYIEDNPEQADRLKKKWSYYLKKY